MTDIGMTLNADAPVERVVEILRHAEHASFDFAYIADQGFTRDVWVTLGAGLQATERLRLGPGVTNPASRSLDATIASMRSLQRIAGDRAFLGLGVGGTRLLGPLHLQRPKPVALLETAILTCRAQIVAYLAVAGRGPRVLELGGRLADEVFLSAKAFFELPSAVQAIQRGAESNPRRLHMSWACHLAINAPTLERIRQRYSYTLVDSTDEVRQRIGLSDDQAHDMMMAARTSGLGASAKWVTDAMLSEFVVLEQQPDQAADHIRSVLDEFGFDAFVVNIASLDVAEDQIDFVRAMMPRLRATYVSRR